MPRPLPKSSILEPTPSDIAIAQSVPPLPITEVTAGLFESGQLEQYGPYKAKVKCDEVLKGAKEAGKGNGYYVCVAGMTPTPLGEGTFCPMLTPTRLRSISIPRTRILHPHRKVHDNGGAVSGPGRAL